VNFLQLAHHKNILGTKHIHKLSRALPVEQRTLHSAAATSHSAAQRTNILHTKGGTLGQEKMKFKD